MFTIVGSHSLLELAARATVLLAVALALAWFTRRGPARVRHLLWTTTFALLLGLPALNLLGPAWEVPLLPAPTRATPVVQPRMPAPAGPAARAATGDISLPPPTPSSPDPTPSSMPLPKPPSPIPSIPLPLLLWGIGCAAALTSLLAGRLRFDRLVRRAQPVDDPIWLRHVDMVRALLDIQGKVRLYLSPRATTPMTGGLWRPAILLPAAAAKWSGGRRRAVLTHELIHVRRRDAPRQLVVRAALALYWFHPLAWVASRLAASAREEACDQEVLALGARPSQYARHLLAVAGGMSPGPSVLSLPMVRHSGSRLEQRIVSILEPNRPRASTIVTALVLTAIGGVGVSASMTHPVRFLSGGTTKVRIVDNPRPPDGSRLGWRIGPQPVVSIGGGEGGDAAMFSDATDATILRDGRIVVADRGTSELRVFDRSGTHVATWGGEGWGPGQFTDLYQVEPFQGDSIVAWSQRNGRLTVLDSQGNFGRVLLLYRDAMQLHFQRYLLEPRRDPQVIFGRRLVVAPWGDLLVVNATDRYEIRAFAAEGTLARVVRRDHGPRTPTPTQVDAYVEARVAQAPGEAVEQRMELRRHYQSVPVADHLPAFGTVMADALDHLWVEEYEVPGEDSSAPLWTVFDAEGRALGFVETPVGLEIQEIGANYIVGRVEDDLGVDFVQVWSLERSAH